MRKGAALPAVLFVIALASALAVGGVYVTRQLATGGRYVTRAWTLQSEAELALVDAVASWDSTLRADQLVGAVAIMPENDGEQIRTAAWITRFSTTGYWLVAESRFLREALPSRRIGLLVTTRGGRPAVVRLRGWSDLP